MILFKMNPRWIEKETATLKIKLSTKWLYSIYTKKTTALKMFFFLPINFKATISEIDFWHPKEDFVFEYIFLVKYI